MHVPPASSQLGRRSEAHACRHASSSGGVFPDAFGEVQVAACPMHAGPQISSPFQHKSDSFYFVDNKLIMHNKAEYQYLHDR